MYKFCNSSQEHKMYDLSLNKEAQASSSSSGSNENSTVSSTVTESTELMITEDDDGPTYILDNNTPEIIMNIITTEEDGDAEHNFSSSNIISSDTTTTTTTQLNTNTELTSNEHNNNNSSSDSVQETEGIEEEQEVENNEQEDEEYVHNNNNDDDDDDKPPLLSPNLPEYPDNNNTSSSVISSTTTDPVSATTTSTSCSSGVSSSLLGPKPPSFDTQLKRGQVKIIRTGDVMYVMKVDLDGKQSIESYSRPVKTKTKSNLTSKRASSSSSSTSSSMKPVVVKKRKIDTSPFKSKRVEGEAAITTISRYCFPTFHDAQLQQLTLVDILQKSKKVVSNILDSSDDHGIGAHHVQFLTNKFLLSDVGSIIMKDWEVLRDIFDGRQKWKVNQMRKVRLLQRRNNNNRNKNVIVSEISYPPSTCFKTLPRIRTAKERKQDMKNYKSFVDLGSRLDFTLLQKKRGTKNTFIVPPPKVQLLLQRSSFYGHLTTKQGKGFTRKYLVNKKATSSSSSFGSGMMMMTSTAAAATVTKKKYAGKSKNKLKNLVPLKIMRKNVGGKKNNKTSTKNRTLNQLKSGTTTTNTATTLLNTPKQEPSALDKLNPRRDKPMAKIRSQVRKVDRMAKLNGDSFHNAALALSRTTSLNRIPIIRTYGVTTTNNNNFQEPSSSTFITTGSTATTTMTNLSTTTTIFSSPSSASSKETDLDLGLEGVCFDSEVNELTNSVMVSAADLEYLEGLDKDSVDLNFSTGTETMTTNSLVAALHAGISNQPTSNSTTSSILLTEPSISSSTTSYSNLPTFTSSTNPTNSTNTAMNSTTSSNNNNNNSNNNNPPLTMDGIGNLIFSTCSNTSTTTINSTTCTSSSTATTTTTNSSLMPLKLDNNNSTNTTDSTGFNFDDMDNRLLEALNALEAVIGEEENSNSKNEMMLEMTPAQNKAFESLENQLIADFQQEELPNRNSNNNDNNDINDINDINNPSNNNNNNDNIPTNTNTKINNNNHASNKTLNMEEIQEEENPTSQQQPNPSLNFSEIIDNNNPHSTSSSVRHKDISTTIQHNPIPNTNFKREENDGNESTSNTLISNNSLLANSFDISTLQQSKNTESQKLSSKVELNTNRSTINKTTEHFVPLSYQVSIASTSFENNTTEEQELELETPTTSSTVSNLGSYKRSIRTTLPPKLESPVKESSSSSSSSSPNKKTAALQSTLTGNYWKTPQVTTATPANRPRREKAGALMATKLGLKNKEARKLAAQEKVKARKSKLLLSPASGQKGAPRSISGDVDTDWNGKFTNRRPYEEPITPDGMIISQKTALKCIVSIPNKFVPTPHENFLEQFVDFFEENELFELYKVFNRVGKGKNSKYFHKKQYEDFKKSDIYIKKFYNKTIKQKKSDSPILSSKSKVVSSSSSSSSSSSTALSPSPPILTPITTTTITTTTKPIKSKTTIAAITLLPTTKILSTSSKPIVSCSSPCLITTPSTVTTTTTLPHPPNITTEPSTFKTEDKEHSKVSVIEKLEMELSNDIPIPEVEISIFKSISNNDSLLKVQQYQSQLSEQKELPPPSPQQQTEQVTLKDENEETIVVPAEEIEKPPTPVPVSKPKSSFHRKRYEDDEKTEYVKVGTCEIVSNGVTYFVDHVNYKMEKDVTLEYDDYDFKPEVTKDLTIKTEDTEVDSIKEEEIKHKLPTTKSKSTDSKAPCTLPYCLLGCVCDSLKKNDRGPRDHCGKLKCMIDCTCGQGSTADDADIRSRLRPRVSMLNWSSRLNYPEAYFQEREILGKMNGSYGERESYNPYAKHRRPIIPPKRNSDFVFHNPSKKSRLDHQTKSLGRQGTGRAATYNRFRLNQRHFTNLKNENAQGKQNKDATLNRLNSDSRGIRKVGLDKITKPVIHRAVQLQRNVAHRTHRTLKPSAHNQQMSRSQIAARNRSIQGNGDLIPPELMARFIPFMEIHVPPPRNKALLLSSDSESSDDENDDDEHEVKHATPRLQRITDPVSTVENKEDVFVPVIVSYTSKQDGFSEIIYPNNDDTNRV